MEVINVHVSLKETATVATYHKKMQQLAMRKVVFHVIEMFWLLLS